MDKVLEEWVKAEKTQHVKPNNIIIEDPYLITSKLDSLSRIYTTAIEQNDIAVIEKVNKKLIELIDKL